MAKNFNRLRSELDERLDALPDGQGDEIRERVAAKLEAEELAHEISLADMRKARRLTQTQLAATLGVTQAQVSRIEHQADLYLSTLRSYVEAMGGTIEISGIFMGVDGDPIRVPLTVEDLADTGTGTEAMKAEQAAAPAHLLGLLERGRQDIKEQADDLRRQLGDRGVGNTQVREIAPARGRKTRAARAARKP